MFKHLRRLPPDSSINEMEKSVFRAGEGNEQHVALDFDIEPDDYTSTGHCLGQVESMSGRLSRFPLSPEQAPKLLVVLRLLSAFVAWWWFLHATN